MGVRVSRVLTYVAGPVGYRGGPWSTHSRGLPACACSSTGSFKRKAMDYAYYPYAYCDHPYPYCEGCLPAHAVPRPVQVGAEGDGLLVPRQLLEGAAAVAGRCPVGPSRHGPSRRSHHAKWDQPHSKWERPKQWPPQVGTGAAHGSHPAAIRVCLLCVFSERLLERTWRPQDQTIRKVALRQQRLLRLSIPLLRLSIPLLRLSIPLSQDQTIREVALRQQRQPCPWIVYTCGPMGAGKGYALSWMSAQGRGAAWWRCNRCNVAHARTRSHAHARTHIHVHTQARTRIQTRRRTQRAKEEKVTKK